MEDSVRRQEAILGLYWGYIGDNGKNMETTIVYWGYIGIGLKSIIVCVSFAFQCYGVWMEGL